MKVQELFENNKFKKKKINITPHFLPQALFAVLLKTALALPETRKFHFALSPSSFVLPRYVPLTRTGSYFFLDIYIKIYFLSLEIVLGSGLTYFFD